VSTNTHKITFVTTKREVKEFINFPYEHYRNDTYWVAPLRMEQKKLVNKNKNPFFNNAEMAMFLAYYNEELVGRIAAIIDHRYNKYHNSEVGFFGFFECENNPNTADLLFKVAEGWLQEKSIKKVKGPANPSMMDEIGILIDGFDKYPAILMPYHKPYYDKLIKANGYEKEVDLLAYHVTQKNVDHDRTNRAMDIVKKRIPGISIREINLKKIHREIKIIRKIFNSAWKNNWGFIPLSTEEFEVLADDLKTIVDTHFAHIAEIDDKPVGFSVALPDYNQIFRNMNGRLLPFGIFKLLWNRGKISRVRTALMGVVPEYRGRGIDALLHREAINNGLEFGIDSSEVGWILENNTNMIRVAERLGGTLEKRYRMYTKKLS